MRLLVTKNIAQNFRTRILAMGYSVVEYPLIRKVPLDYTQKNNFSHWIFTSSYAAQLVLENHILKTQLSDKSIFCVGKKTAALFLENGQKVIKIAQYAAELALFIVKNHKNDAFSIFCGKQRRPEIEQLLDQNAVALDLHELYDTLLQPQQFSQSFDGILFYSPSAVRSFVEKNAFGQATAFCLGRSTAEEAQKYTDNISIAKTPEEACFLIELKKHFDAQKRPLS